MSINRLPFADIILLRDDIAECIIHEGIEMDVRMVVQYHDFLIENLTSPFSLLINKLNSYTYTFEAQKKLGSIPHINAMAVVTYRNSSKISTESLNRIPRAIPWNMKSFSERDSAVEWLIEQQALVKQNNVPSLQMRHLDFRKRLLS